MVGEEREEVHLYIGGERERDRERGREGEREAGRVSRERVC
jgi:hypothetical protein